MAPSWHVGPVTVPIHGLFVALGVLAAMVVFVAESRRRGAVNEPSAVAVAGALVGGASLKADSFAAIVKNSVTVATK